jgi:basic membrane protein A
VKKTARIGLVVSALVLGLAACGGDDDSGNGDGGGGDAPQSDVKVGVAYDIGGRGDQSFNDSAAAGLDQAVEEFGFEIQESEAAADESEAAREERLRTFAENGFDPIIAVGFAYTASMVKVAPEYPDVHFALVDGDFVASPELETMENVATLVFTEEQGSFLVGAAAALKTKTDHVGFIGGVEVPLLQKFEAGFTAGAKEVTPDIQVDVSYLTQAPDFTGFNDPAKGTTAAAGMLDNGADIIYAAAGGSNAGVMEAASAADAWVIGVDSDQYNIVDESLRDVVLTSMIKNVNVAVLDYLTQVSEGTFPSGVKTYDLAVDGVGYSTSGGFIDDITDQLEDYKQQIIDGEITVPTEP